MNIVMKGKKINKDFLQRGAKAILPDDIRIAAENSDKMEDKVKRSTSLRSYLKDLILLGNLVKDYWKGSYRNIEYKAIAVVVFTLLYVMSTIDLIPDFIPGMGLLDDASVIAFCLNIVKTELEKYKEWKLA